MNKLEKIRARLAEIVNQLKAYDGQDTELSEDQIKEIDGLNAEFEKLTSEESALKKMDAMKAAASKSARKVDPASGANPEPRVEVVRDSKDRFGGFNSSGEFLMAVRDFSSGKVAPQFKSAMYEKNGEDGGILVPEEISTSILNKLKEQESLLARCTQFQVGGNNLTLKIDEAQPWNQGITAYWMAEGGQYTGSKNKLAEASWKVQKLGALVQATDELLEDAVAMESYIRAAAPAAIMHKINEAIVSGDGVGKPQGILNSSFAVTVSKESGQSADTIVARNIINMYSRMLPSSRANAAWYVNAQAEPQLLGLKDDLGNFIYLAPGSQMNGSPYGMLLGRPVIPMMSALPALGDVGDIVFSDLSYYYAVLKAGGVKSAVSIHLLFDKDITSYKFSMRIDGKCPFKSPVTTQYGNYQMSSVVLLEAR